MSGIGATFDKELKQRIFILYGDRDNGYSITLGASETTIYTGDILYLSGTLLHEGEGVSNASVKIYKGTTLIATETTGNDGSFSTQVESLSVGQYSFKATYNDEQSNTVNVTVYEPVISVTTQNVNMVYKDGTQFIATVTRNDTPYGVGENVTFSINGTSTTKQIDANGQAKYDIGLDVGTHTITSTFGSVTKTNTITITKATTTTTLTSSSSSISTAESVTLSGSVTGNGLTTGEVKIYDGGTLLSTETLTNGAYSKTLTGLSAGIHNFMTEFEATSNYAGSYTDAVTVTVTQLSHDYALALTGTPIIQTGDSDTITATLTDGGSPVASTSLAYQIKHGSTVLDSGTATTNSSGVATVSYTGTGIGDVDVIVSNTDMNLQETFVVEDCFFYRASGTKTFTSSYNIENIVDINGLTGDYEISATLKSSATKGFGMGLNTANTNENKTLLRLGYESGNNPYFTRMQNGSVSEEYKLSNTQYTANIDVSMKLTKVNGVYTGYIGGNNHAMGTAPSGLRYVQLEGWSTSKTVTYTDFKVKAL